MPGEVFSQKNTSENKSGKRFYRQQQGEDITKERKYYQNVLARFKQKYHMIPVLVSK